MFDEIKFRQAVLASGKTYREIAKALDINESTLSRKITNGGSFTRDEINTLIDFLDIKDPMEIFFARKLA